MSHIIDTETSFHGEAVGQQVWKDVMTEEYQSIMKNDVWDIVLISEEKFVVTSKWIYKIKHAIDGSVRTKRYLWLEDSLRWREYIMRIHLLMFLDTLPSV
jgi:hypothetical protein